MKNYRTAQEAQDCEKRIDAYDANELKEFNDGRVEEIVTRAVSYESINDRLEEISLDDVPVVELIL